MASKLNEKINSVFQQLLNRAKEKGCVTLDDLMEVFPEAETNLAELEELFIHLSDEGVQVLLDEGKGDGEGGAEAVASADGKGKAVSARHRAKPSVAGTGPVEADLSEIASDDTISLYLKEMAKVPLLTAQEEVSLARQFEEGRLSQDCLAHNGRQYPAQGRQRPAQGHLSESGQEKLRESVRVGEGARAHLIKANTRLVVSIAKRYLGQGVPFLDLIQEGNLGLIKAVEKFDYHRGHRFSTYATWWIRQAITRALADQGRVIRLPVHLSDRIRKVYQVSQRLEQDWGRQPTPEDIAEELALPPQKVRWMLKVSQRPLSLEKPVGEEEDSELGNFIPDEEAPTPSDTAYHRLLQERLEEVLVGLTPREARILRLRFGLYDGRSYTLEEVGRKFGLTRERIRQIEHEALDRLRHPSRSRQLRDYLV